MSYKTSMAAFFDSVMRSFHAKSFSKDLKVILFPCLPLPKSGWVFVLLTCAIAGQELISIWGLLHLQSLPLLVSNTTINAMLYMFIFQSTVSFIHHFLDVSNAELRIHCLGHWRKSALLNLREINLQPHPASEATRLQHFLNTELDQCADFSFIFIRMLSHGIILGLIAVLVFFQWGPWSTIGMLVISLIYIWVSQKSRQQQCQLATKWHQDVESTERELLPLLQHREHWMGLNWSKKVLKYIYYKMDTSEQSWKRAYLSHQSHHWMLQNSGYFTLIIIGCCVASSSRFSSEQWPGIFFFIWRTYPLAIRTLRDLNECSQLLPILRSCSQQFQSLQELAQGVPSQLQNFRHDDEPDSQDSSTWIKIDKLCFAYSEKNKVFQSLTTSFHSGQLHLVFGPNGCGKTTLLKLIAGYFSGSSGTIERHLTDEECLDIIYLPKESWLFPGTIEDHLHFYPEPQTDVQNQIFVSQHIDRENNGGHRSQAKDEVFDERQQLIREHNDLFTAPSDEDIAEAGSNLSAGQKKILTLQRFFMQSAKVYLLDEPCDGLDEDHRRRWINFCENLAQSHLVIVASHHMDWQRKFTVILDLSQDQ